jgi:hypothetical protein
MGANVIEKVSHLVERILQTGWAVNLDLPDERFDPTKEAFDVAVAPWSADWNSLVTNADQLQEGLEHRAFEDQFVVSADGVGFAMLADGQAQVADQRPAALVDRCCQLRADARAVIDDAQNGPWCATVVSHKRQIHAPDAVDTRRCRALVAQFAGNVEQQVLVVADGVADKGFADSCWRMQPVESVSDFAATDLLAHQCLEAQHFAHNPVRLFAGQWGWDVNSSRVRRGASCEALTLLPADALGQMGQSEKHWCHEQKRDQREEPNEHGQKSLDYAQYVSCRSDNSNLIIRELRG